MTSKLKPRGFAPAALAGVCLLAACGGGVDAEGTPRRIAKQVDQALTTVAENELAADPELAARLGLTEAAVGYPFGRYLTDRSQAAYERKRMMRIETLDALLRTPRPAEGSAQARHLDTVIAAYETAKTLFLSGHGDTGLGVTYPFAADHTRGAYIDVPFALTEHVPLRSVADADAFEARLDQFAGAVEDERRRLLAESAAGIVPPAPIVSRMLVIAVAASERPLAETPLLIRFSAQLGAVSGLSAQERLNRVARVSAILEKEVRPAHQAFVRALTGLQASAPQEPGLWQLTDGAAYYDAALEAIAGGPADPASLHAKAKADVAIWTGELDRALAAAGLAEGSVASRLTTLAAMPGQVYPDTEEGRSALVARIEALLAKISARLEIAFGALPKTRMEIVPGAGDPLGSVPAAFYRAAPADQSASARLDVDLLRLAASADFSLATVVFHEGIPGHHLESASTSELAQLPLARQLVSNATFSEGWASYAETLADEAGVYGDDPLGRIGYLQSMLHRAAGVVAETGLHHARWPRADTIAYLVTTTGLPEAAMTDEVDRLSVTPGSTLAFWLGRQRLLDLRETSMRVLGPKFDLKAFHAVILTGGPRPLGIVEDDVERWYGSQID